MSEEADLGNALVQHLWSTTKSSARELRGSSCALLLPASPISNHKPLRLGVLAGDLHIYGDSASSFVSLKALVLCVSVCLCVLSSAHTRWVKWGDKNKTIDLLAAQLQISYIHIAKTKAGTRLRLFCTDLAILFTFLFFFFFVKFYFKSQNTYFLLLLLFYWWCGFLFDSSNRYHQSHELLAWFILSENSSH